MNTLKCKVKELFRQGKVRSPPHIWLPLPFLGQYTLAWLEPREKRCGHGSTVNMEQHPLTAITVAHSQYLSMKRMHCKQATFVKAGYRRKQFMVLPLIQFI